MGAPRHGPPFPRFPAPRTPRRTMGRQWLQKKREINANKRARMTTKLVREISVAAKMGAPDPDMNPRLAVAVEAARKASVSNDVIGRAIKKGSGESGESMELELITFEGMSPQNVPVVVECLTDNRNRTAPDMRALFRAGQFGTKVMFFFDHVGLIEATHADGALDPEEAAIEAGAQDIEPAEGLEEGSAARFITDPKDLDTVTTSLRKSGWSVTASDLGYRAKEPATISDEDRAAHDAFLEAIDDHDDCHRIYSA